MDCNCFSFVRACLQGPHQDAQKSRRTTLPLERDKSDVLEAGWSVAFSFVLIWVLGKLSSSRILLDLSGFPFFARANRATSPSEVGCSSCVEPSGFISSCGELFCATLLVPLSEASWDEPCA